MIRLVLFDLDGTLLDTAPDIIAALHAALRERGLPLPEDDQMRAQVSHGTGAMLRAALDGRSLPEAEFNALRARLIEHYRARLCIHTRPLPGMAELLAWLEQSGLAWGVVTNKPSHLTNPLMQAIGLAARAACIVSGDEATRPKPHPAPLLLACERAGLPVAGSVYVGDAARDIEAAHAAGMPAIASGR